MNQLEALKDRPLNIFKLVLSFVAAYAAAGIGSIATIENIPTWYAALEKPFLNPPNWVFGPVWSVLYALIAISIYLFWSADAKKSKTLGSVAIVSQLVLNTLWSIVFFGLQQPILGIIVILALIVAIVANIIFFRPVSKTAAYLLIPYLLWVSFATYLTVSIAILN